MKKTIIVVATMMAFAILIGGIHIGAIPCVDPPGAILTLFSL